MNASKKPLHVFVSDKLVHMKVYTSQSPQNDGDALMEYAGRDEVQRTRWIFACIISLLVGVFIGLAVHDHLATFDANRPVWKSFPLSSSSHSHTK
jgi:hypothetical protein